MAIATLRHKGYQWIAAERSDEATINFLQENFRFHQLDFEDVKSESSHPKIDVYKHYLFLITHFPTEDSDTQRVIANELDIFLEENTIITVPTNFPSPYLENLMARLQRNFKLREEWFSKGPSFFCYKLLKGLYHDSFKPFRASIAAHLKGIDERLFSQDNRRVLLNLARVRRDVLDMKRIIDPQRFVIRDLAALNVSFVPQEMAPYFDDLRDLLDRLWMAVESYDSIVKSFADTNESLISLRTNEVIKVLAVISVAFLPLTFVTGVYGMNLSALPLADNPTTIWFIFAFIAGFLAILFGILKKIRWL